MYSCEFSKTRLGRESALKNLVGERHWWKEKKTCEYSARQCIKVDSQRGSMGMSEANGLVHTICARVVRLNMGALDFAVFDNKGVALGAVVAKEGRGVELEVKSPRELAGRIAQEPYLSVSVASLPHSYIVRGYGGSCHPAGRKLTLEPCVGSRDSPQAFILLSLHVSIVIVRVCLPFTMPHRNLVG